LPGLLKGPARQRLMQSEIKQQFVSSGTIVVYGKVAIHAFRTVQVRQVASVALGRAWHPAHGLVGYDAPYQVVQSFREVLVNGGGRNVLL